MLLEADGEAEEGDMVIGGEESDQAEGNATDGLGDTETVQAKLAEIDWAEASLGRSEEHTF